MTPEVLEKLRAPFPDSVVGKLPREGCYNCGQLRKNGGKPWDCCDRHTYFGASSPCPDCGGKHGSGAIHLDFVGHADVTDRLLTVDPGWYWEPMALSSEGTPLIGTRKSNSVMWIKLTVGDVTRIGVGTCGSDKLDAEKELIGDAIRNAAMRFGVALSLWSKAEQLESQIDEGLDTDDTPDPPKVETPATEDYVSGSDLSGLICRFNEIQDGDKRRDAKYEFTDRLRCEVDRIPVDRLKEAEEIVDDIVTEASDQQVKAKSAKKADVIALKPSDMEDADWMADVIAKASELNPEKLGSPMTWEWLQRRPALVDAVLALVRDGSFYEPDPEPFEVPADDQGALKAEAQKMPV